METFPGKVIQYFLPLGDQKVKMNELARVPNRYTAGLLEVAMKEHIADKTNWRKMLSGSDPGDLDLIREKERLSALAPTALAPFMGQYLMLDQNRVINMRKFGGYLIRLQTGH